MSDTPAVKLTERLLTAADSAEALSRVDVYQGKVWSETARRELESLAFLLREAADDVSETPRRALLDALKEEGGDRG